MTTPIKLSKLPAILAVAHIKFTEGINESFYIYAPTNLWDSPLTTTASYDANRSTLTLSTDLRLLEDLPLSQSGEPTEYVQLLIDKLMHKLQYIPDATEVTRNLEGSTLTTTWILPPDTSPPTSTIVLLDLGNCKQLTAPFVENVVITIINEEEDGAEQGGVPADGPSERADSPDTPTANQPLNTPVVLYGFIQPNKINPNLITLVAITRPTGYEFAFVCRVCGGSGAGKIVLDEHRTEWGQRNAVTMDKPPLTLYGGPTPTLQYLAEIRDPSRPHDQLTTYVFT
jgi:hypothetical protein